VSTETTTSSLRGRSLVGAQLSAVSLAGSDLRGTDFSGADLHGADLSHARSGMSRSWAAIVAAGAFVCSIGIGLAAGVCTRYLHALHSSDERRLRVAAWFVTAMLLVFVVAGIVKGLAYAVRVVLPTSAAIAAVVAVAAIVTGVGTGKGALVALVFLAFVALVVALSVLVRAVAGTEGRVIFALVAITGGLAGAAVGGGLGSTAIAIGAMLMARRSAKLESAFPLLERTIAAIASRGGTSFRGATLANANLSDARWIACDFRGADLTGARFEHATLRACRFDRGRDVANERTSEPSSS
jgi:hypothetical protein